MRKPFRYLAWLLLALLVLLPALALAQTGGGYDLTWSTIDGGGYTFSTGWGYSLGGTEGVQYRDKLERRWETSGEQLNPSLCLRQWYGNWGGSTYS